MSAEQAECEKMVPVSAGMQKEWADFRAAIDAAAKPFTGKDHLALPGFYAHEIPAADAELDRALHQLDKADSGSFIQDKDGNLLIRLTWTEEVELAA